MDPVLAGALLTTAASLLGLLIKLRTDHGAQQQQALNDDDRVAAELRDDLQVALDRCREQEERLEARIALLLGQCDTLRAQLEQRDEAIVRLSRQLGEVQAELDRWRPQPPRKGG